MNRRSFLITGSLAAGVPAAVGGWLASSRPERIRFEQFPRVRLPLRLAEGTRRVLGLIEEQADEVYLFGGPVATLASGAPVPWLNVLIQARPLRRLKRELFELGVEPVAAPEAPEGFIRFAYEGVNYKVLNLAVEDFCQRNAIEARLDLIPYAHSFLVYEPRREFLYDPHDALGTRGAGQAVALKLVARPRSHLAALDAWLGGVFDVELLKLARSGDFDELQHFVLGSEAPRAEWHLITERFLNYLPDLVEVCGYEGARPLIRSRLIRAATRGTLKIDVDRLDQRAMGLAAGGALEEHTFLRLINEEMGGVAAGVGRQYNDIDHYMLANAFSVRRIDLMKYLV
jgi:hypothetical protein